jgi:hypothetical protein
MMHGKFAQRLLWVIWPAFLVAGAAEMIFFSVFDPTELPFFGAPAGLSREAFYTLGFFSFWGLGIASSALTVFLGRSPFEVDRCPLDADTRPFGCPKREVGDERPDLRAGVGG